MKRASLENASRAPETHRMLKTRDSRDRYVGSSTTYSSRYEPTHATSKAWHLQLEEGESRKKARFRACCHNLINANFISVLMHHVGEPCTRADLCFPLQERSRGLACGPWDLGTATIPGGHGPRPTAHSPQPTATRVFSPRPSKPRSPQAPR